MPKFLEAKLKAEYGAKNKHAIYGTMNKIGAMHGNKITAKGEAMQAKHEKHVDNSNRSVRNRSSHSEKLKHG